FEADDVAALALALAAAAEVETQRDIAELGEKLRRRFGRAGILAGAEAVQHEEGRAAPAGLQVVGRGDDTRQLEAGGREGDGCFHGVRLAGRRLFLVVYRGAAPVTRNSGFQRLV